MLAECLQPFQEQVQERNQSIAEYADQQEGSELLLSPLPIILSEDPMSLTVHFLRLPVCLSKTA